MTIWLSASSKRCVVTRRVLDDGVPVGYLYREDSSSEDDSGWTLNANDEAAEYMEQTSNFAVVSLGVILNRDDSLFDLLSSPVGSAFARDRKSGKFLPDVE
jgi:hypothetical protein